MASLILHVLALAGAAVAAPELVTMLEAFDGIAQNSHQAKLLQDLRFQYECLKYEAAELRSGTGSSSS